MFIIYLFCPNGTQCNCNCNHCDHALPLNNHLQAQDIKFEQKCWIILYANELLGGYHARAEQLGELGIPGCDEALRGMAGAFLTNEVPGLCSGGFHPKLVTPPYHGFLKVNTPPNSQNSKRHFKCNAISKSPSGSIIIGNMPPLIMRSPPT